VSTGARPTSPPRVPPWALALCLLLVGSCSRQPTEAPARLTLFAAASLADVAEDLADAFEAREAERGEAVEVTLNVAGSNTLARQIRAAPAADVFLSADGRWVDVVEAAGRAQAGTRRPVYGNRLVLVARPDADAAPPFDPRRLGEAPLRHLAVADPEAVPAGRYTRAALEALGTPGAGNVWDEIEDRLAPTADVRAALALAESDPRVWAVVYATDAASSSRVRVLAEVPDPPGEPIVYWAVALDGPRPESARRFVEFLGTDAARELGSRYGFTAPPPVSP
jgi:molybdate transport system substrate-binding protein